MNNHFILIDSNKKLQSIIITVITIQLIVISNTKYFKE